jgi:hypothetical protein
MRFIPPTLLVGYAVYSAFVPSISIAHSLILFSLAGLFAWNQWLLSRETPQLQTELAKMQASFDQKMAQQKEAHDKKMSELDGELQKVTMSVVRSSSSPSSKTASERKQYQF